MAEGAAYAFNSCVQRHARWHGTQAMPQCGMQPLDLNLLTALDALLNTGSVAQAARALGLSASATSRTLARLRAATGDPLLVRAGRGLVPTPHALALQARVRALAEEVRTVLRPAPDGLDVATLDRVFTLRANEGFVETFAARLVSAAAAQAPFVRLRFAPKPDKDVRPLREGLIDLDIGVLGESAPEVRVQALFRDKFVGVVRQGHKLLAAPITAETYAACGHIAASRRLLMRGPVDDALAARGLERRVAVSVPSFPAALAVAAGSDLVALVTESFVRGSGADAGRGAVVWFALPVATETITVSQMWHPRMDGDAGHRWLRGVVLAGCRG